MAKSTASDFIIANSVFNGILPQKLMLNSTNEELLKTFEFKSAVAYVDNISVEKTSLDESTSSQVATSTRVRYQAKGERPLTIPIRAFFNINVSEDDKFDYATAKKKDIDKLIPMYEHIAEELSGEDGMMLPKTIRIVSVRPQTIKDAADQPVDIYPINHYKRYQEEVEKLEAAEKAEANALGRKPLPVNLLPIYRNQALMKEIQLTGKEGVDLERFPDAQPLKDIVAIVL